MTDKISAAPSRAGRKGDSQAMPIPNGHVDIQTLVIRELDQRRELGIERYGTALQPFNGRDALQDLYEELMDGMVYIRQEIEERKVTDALVGQLLAAASTLRAAWEAEEGLALTATASAVVDFIAALDAADGILGVQEGLA